MASSSQSPINNYQPDQSINNNNNVNSNINEDLNNNINNNILTINDQSSLIPSSLSLQLSPLEIDLLRRLPVETLDTIRSKLVQLIEAITTFKFQLETSNLTPTSLPYSTLISKFLILLNHTEALSQALNTSPSSSSIRSNNNNNSNGLVNDSSRFELPNVRIERELRSRWEDGPNKRSSLGNINVYPRGLDGLEDGKDWIVGVLTRTKLAPEIESDEQDLLDMIQPPCSFSSPNRSTALKDNNQQQNSSSSSPHSISDVLIHIRNLTEKHENHINNCKKALHKARYHSSSLEDQDDRMEVDNNKSLRGGVNDEDEEDENGGGGGVFSEGEGEERFEWKMRVEVDDRPVNDRSVPKNFNGNVNEDEINPGMNPIIKGLLGFMKDGRSPNNQTIGTT